MTFLIQHKDGTIEFYYSRYDEDNENERDVAFNDAYAIYSDSCVTPL